MHHLLGCYAPLLYSSWEPTSLQNDKLFSFEESFLYFTGSLIDHNKELKRIDKSSQGNSSNCEDDSSKEVDCVVQGNERSQGDLRKKYVASSCETLEGSNTEINESAKGTYEAGDMEVSKSDAMASEIRSDAEEAQVDSFVEESLQSPELLDYAVQEGKLEADIGLERGENVASLKRKRNEVDMVSDASAVVASKDTCVSHVDVVTSSPTGRAEICGTCFKRQRYWIFSMLFHFFFFCA